jgi:hypothetical protein
MTTATDRETERLVPLARRRLAAQASALVAVVVAGIVLAVALGTMLGRATRWKSELLRSGRPAVGTVVDLHRGTGSRDPDRVSVRYVASEVARQITIDVDRLSRYRLGQPVDVRYDPATAGHVRTTWDAKQDPAEPWGGLALLADAFLVVGAVVYLPRSVIGVALGRGVWTTVSVDVHYRPPAYRERAHLLVRFPDDETPFGNAAFVLPRFTSGRYAVRTVGKGRWRVVATGRPVAVVRRARNRFTAGRWLRVFLPGAGGSG